MQETNIGFENFEEDFRADTTTSFIGTPAPIKETIEEILGISIKAVTNTGRVRTVHLTDFQNEKDSTIAFNHDDIKSPREQIVATINCDDYLVRIE